MRPLSEMSIDKRFAPADEPVGRQRTRVDVITGKPPTAERSSRTSEVADLEHVLPHVREGWPQSAWQIRCEDCDPQHGGYYWFSLVQCDTPAKALDCIMQLNEKHLSPVVVESFIDLIEYLFGRGPIVDG